MVDPIKIKAKAYLYSLKVLWSDTTWIVLLNNFGRIYLLFSKQNYYYLL